MLASFPRGISKRQGYLIALALCACALLAGCGETSNSRDDSVREADGKYFDAEGSPTFKVHRNGAVDWYTFSGYLHFTSTCLVCHGSDAAGSTFAPPLMISLNKLTYEEFVATVMVGRKNNTMPSFRQNKTVMCHLDDIYVYLRARARRAVGHGKPEKHEPKPPAATTAEDECFGPSRHRRAGMARIEQ